MSPLAQRLATHGLLEQAEAVARAHGLSLGQLVAEPSAARVQLWIAIADRGWSARNIERVFGIAAPAMPRAKLSHERTGPAAARTPRRPPLLGPVRRAETSGSAPSPARPATTPARGHEEAGTLPLRVIPLARLLAGPGERRDDCRRHTDCLDAFVRARLNTHAAHCPPSCRAFLPIPRDSALQLASVGGVSALAEAAQGRRQGRADERHAPRRRRGHDGPVDDTEEDAA